MATVMRSGTVSRLHRHYEHRHYEPVAEGEHARRLSLLTTFVGIPAAALGWQIWSVLFQGPGAAVQEPRYHGWGAVAVMLPATLVVVGTAATAVVLAARARAAHVPHGDQALALSAVGLLLVLAVLGTVSADTVTTTTSATVGWVVRAVALAVTAAAGGVALWWAGPARR